MSRERPPPGGAIAGEPRGDERSRDEAGRAERDRRRSWRRSRLSGSRRGRAVSPPPTPSSRWAARFGDLDGPGLDAIPEGDRQVRVAGRITARRSFGKASLHPAAGGAGVAAGAPAAGCAPRAGLRGGEAAGPRRLGGGLGAGVPAPGPANSPWRADALSFLAKALLPPPRMARAHSTATRATGSGISTCSGTPPPARCSAGAPRWCPRCGASWTARGSSKSRTRCCSRSPPARRRGRSGPGTGRSAPSSTCGSPPSST